ncbi:MAG: hypothetical protein ABII18_11175 [bacterium]|nr:hypothetical protein [bacterium]MBU1918075.1 hypothetical protein [bacterium]
MSAKPYQIPKRAAQIILAISRALVFEPEDLNIPNRDEALLQRCRSILQELPVMYRMGFVMGIYLFDLCAFLFGCGFKRFISLSYEKQCQYLDKCLTNKMFTVRNIMSGMRGLIMICYFSMPEVSAYIGYNPNKHVKERLALREKLLKGSGRKA